MKGKDIKKLRNALGEKQRDFAIRLGMSGGGAATVSKWETGYSTPNRYYQSLLTDIAENLSLDEEVAHEEGEEETGWVSYVTSEVLESDMSQYTKRKIMDLVIGELEE